MKWIKKNCRWSGNNIDGGCGYHMLTSLTTSTLTLNKIFKMEKIGKAAFRKFSLKILTWL